MHIYDEVVTAAQSLSPSERIRLVQALWETVSPEDWLPPSQEWIDEAQRRSMDYDAGRLTAAPWSEARARARRKAELDE
jgi:putative addiction module component (TIGR02574 family)